MRSRLALLVDFARQALPLLERVAVAVEAPVPPSSMSLPPLTHHTLLNRTQLRQALRCGQEQVRDLWPCLPRQRLPGRVDLASERVLWGDVLAALEHIEPAANDPTVRPAAGPPPTAHRRPRSRNAR